MARLCPDDIVMMCRGCHMIEMGNITHKDRLMKCDHMWQTSDCGLSSLLGDIYSGLRFTILRIFS